MSEEVLSGGGLNEVVRIGDTVRRPHSPWSDRVNQLLIHLEKVQFRGAPRFFGTGGGHDFLEYLPGEVGNYPLSSAARSTTALVTAARLLRDYHDATQGLAAGMRGGWMFDDHEPAEVICHGDFAPYNCVFDGERVIGMIDFDTAHPGPRLRDLGYAIYRYAPLAGPSNDDTFGSIEEQAKRALLICNSYGLDDRSGVVGAVIDRLRDLVDFMRVQAAAGNAAFAAHVAGGHDQLYLNDIAYVEANAELLNAELEADG